jgi:aspartyl-tRNA(Asn)/glutamyl-tRNA(Gln) amidotransferase subunit C
MSITLEEVRHVAKLARLDLDETEIFSLQGELNALLGHFADIQDIDTEGIEPKSHAVSLQNIWAEDIPGPTLSRQRAGLFLVPAIIEE